MVIFFNMREFKKTTMVLLYKIVFKLLPYLNSYHLLVHHRNSFS